MKTKKKSLTQDRKRISAQKHEVAYAGTKVRGGTPAVRKAKAALGRKVGRAAVMKKAGGRV